MHYISRFLIHLPVLFLLLIFTHLQAWAQSDNPTPEECEVLLADRTLIFDLIDWSTITYSEYLTILEENPDDDGDSLSNDKEYCYGSSPDSPDTDGDRMDDGFEFKYGFNSDPVTGNDGEALLDRDGDGLIAAVEAEQLQDRYSPHIADNFYYAPEADPVDFDKDGILDGNDSCPFDNLDDADGDGVCANFSCVGCEITGDCPHYCKVSDNCPGYANADQLDTNLDGVGDACQCGDLNTDGAINSLDVDILSNAPFSIMGENNSLTMQQLQNCDVNGDGVCSIDDRDLLAAYVDPLNPAYQSIINDYTTEILMPTGQVDGNENPIFASSQEFRINLRCADNTVTAKRALLRLGYGQSNSAKGDELIENISKNGLENYIMEQLNPESIDDSVYINDIKGAYAAGSFPVLGQSYNRLRDIYCNENSCENRIDGHQRIPKSLAEIKLHRSVYSNRQLDTVLSDFWFNHFNVYAGFGQVIWLVPQYQDIIDAKIYGSFEDLLMAITKAPAMMNYLNLNYSSKTAPNQNYAREVMELHSIGKEDTYDDGDVNEVARILTGYYYQAVDTNDGSFGVNTIFDVGRHDLEPKTVELVDYYGGADTVWKFAHPTGNASCEKTVADGSTTTIEASVGEKEVEVLMCLLARHPKTAEMIGKKLIRRFLGDEAIDGISVNGNDLLEQFIEQWVDNHGDLKHMYRFLLTKKPGGFDRGSYFERSLFLPSNKVKRPLVFAASALRAANIRHRKTDYVNSTFAFEFKNSYYGIMGDFDNNGEKLYRIAPPTGYSELGVSWQGNNTTLMKFDQAIRIINESNDMDPKARIMFESVQDEEDNEWLYNIVEYYDYVYDNRRLVAIIAERLLPTTGLDPLSFAEIVNYLNLNFPTVPKEDAFSAGYTIRNDFNDRKEAATKLILSLPRAFYH